MGKPGHHQASATLLLFGLWGVLLASPAPGNPGKDKGKPPADNREAGFFGVVTEFAVKPAEVTHADEVKITLKMTNVTPQRVRFRYSACIEGHVELFNSDGKEANWKHGAPIPECPYLEVEIQPGATVERSARFHFGRYYSVPAGGYEIGFRYDLRLMKAPEAGKDPWIPWGKARFKLRVKE